MKRTFLRALTTTCFALSCTVSVVAQSNRGTIDGTVSDRIGHKVASAAVEARNMDTGAAFNAETDAQGVYTLSLPGGTYEVSITAAGHRSTQQGIVVTPARPLHGIDVVLAIP
jgi:hypothetical protein